MDPNQRRGGLHIAHHQGYSFLNPAVSVGTEFGPKTVDSKLSPASGKIRGRNLPHILGGHVLGSHISIIAVTRIDAADPEPT